MVANAPIKPSQTFPYKGQTINVSFDIEGENCVGFRINTAWYNAVQVHDIPEYIVLLQSIYDYINLNWDLVYA